MTLSEFTVEDRPSGIALNFDPVNSRVTARYTPPGEPFAMEASLHISDDETRRCLQELCEGAGRNAEDRGVALETRLTWLPSRAKRSLNIAARVTISAMEWLLTSNEHTNWTYDLHPRNLSHLAAMTAVATKRSVNEIAAFIAEPDADDALNAHVRETIATTAPGRIGVADNRARWGRRLGWYAVVRALKPNLVVETGVDKGLGSVLLCAALTRNAAEGHVGRYLGTDINPKAGYLLGGAYQQFGRIQYGDSIETLKTLTEPVNVLINDSDHSADYEYREYQTLAPLLNSNSVILGDNAHSTDMLIRFAAETGRQFLFFRELPQGHWYPGAGLGFAFT